MSTIPLPFTPASVRAVLDWGRAPETSPYSHQQIAQWCDAFWCQHLDDDPPAEIERLLPILADVECQWDLYLASTFSLEDLRTRDFDSVTLPASWFEEWWRQAVAIHQAT